MRFLINVNKRRDKRVVHKCIHYILNREVLNFVVELYVESLL